MHKLGTACLSRQRLSDKAMLCRLMRDYERQRAIEGDLTEQDMPAELLADVEGNQTEDDRSAHALLSLFTMIKKGARLALYAPC